MRTLAPEWTTRTVSVHKVLVHTDPTRVFLSSCIFSGSQAVHEKAPHIASLMIAGPRGVGKKMLVQAICTEVGANMFDLTPANIAERYPGKAGLNMLLHMVFKVYVYVVVMRYTGSC